MDELEDGMSKELLEGAAVHMKMELIYQMSPVTLKIHIGPHSQTIQVKGSLRTRYAQNPWQTNRGALPALSVLEITTISSWSLISSLGFKTKAKMNMDWQEE